MLSKLAKNSYVLLIYAFLYAPIFLLIAYSFNDAIYSISWQGFTLQWYQKLFDNTPLWTTALHSLILGLCAATGATTLGTLAAINFYRYRFAGRKLFHGLIFVLLMTPDLVLAIAFLVLFSTIKLPLGFFTLLLSHITFCMPFVAITVFSALRDLDHNLFEAAKDLGATEFTLVSQIIVPLIWPAIIAAWLLSFTLSLDDVVISYFVTGPTYEILPLKIYSLARTGIKPDLNAICSILFITSLVFVVGAHWLQRKQERRYA